MIYLFHPLAFNVFHRGCFTVSLNALPFLSNIFIINLSFVYFTELDADYFVEALSLIGVKIHILDPEEYINDRATTFAQCGPIVLCSGRNTTVKVLQKVTATSKFSKSKDA